MTVSVYAKKRREKLKKEALVLHKQGLDLRTIGRALSPQRSHEWVRKALKEMGYPHK